MLLGQFRPLVDFDLPGSIGKICKVHHRCPITYSPVQLLPGFDFDELYPGCSQLMIKRVAMRLLNDHFRFHAGQVRQLLDEAFVVTGQDAGQSGLNGSRCARSDQRTVALWQLEHLRDTLARCRLQFRDAHEMSRRLRHYGFDFRLDERTA